MTLEIQQSCFPFSAFALSPPYGSDMHFTVPRKFLSHLIRHIEKKKNLSMHRYNQNLLGVQSVPAIKCSYLGLQGQSSTFSSVSSFSFTKKEGTLANFGSFELCALNPFPSTSLSAKSAERQQRLSSVPEYQLSCIQDKHLTVPVCGFTLGWTQTREQKVSSEMPGSYRR